jgi:hypothetical protein
MSEKLIEAHASGNDDFEVEVTLVYEKRSCARYASMGDDLSGMVFKSMDACDRFFESIGMINIDDPIVDGFRTFQNLSMIEREI